MTTKSNNSQQPGESRAELTPARLRLWLGDGFEKAEHPLEARRALCQRGRRCPNLVDAYVGEDLVWACFGDRCNLVWEMNELQGKARSGNNGCIPAHPRARYWMSSDGLSEKQQDELHESKRPLTYRRFTDKVCLGRWSTAFGKALDEHPTAEFYTATVGGRPVYVLRVDGFEYLFVQEDIWSQSLYLE